MHISPELSTDIVALLLFYGLFFIPNLAVFLKLWCEQKKASADRENRTPTSSLARTRPTTKRYPRGEQRYYSRFSDIPTILCSRRDLNPQQLLRRQR